jgi:hypothetical protein
VRCAGRNRSRSVLDRTGLRLSSVGGLQAPAVHVWGGGGARAIRRDWASSGSDCYVGWGCSIDVRREPRRRSVASESRLAKAATQSRVRAAPPPSGRATNVRCRRRTVCHSVVLFVEPAGFSLALVPWSPSRLVGHVALAKAFEPGKRLL